eukprot:9038161-Heterocapsa_arctica.AAC.1
MAVTGEQAAEMLEQVRLLTGQINRLAGEAQAAQQCEQGLRRYLDANIAGGQGGAGGRQEQEGGM